MSLSVNVSQEKSSLEKMITTKNKIFYILPRPNPLKILKGHIKLIFLCDLSKKEYVFIDIKILNTLYNLDLSLVL